MPTDAFIKLDDNKKRQILEAAVKEFSELPYSKVSIFKIAQHAGVSRSGFYYYFRDKKDVYDYLLNIIKDDFVETYKIGQGNRITMFQLAESIFEYVANIKGTAREPFFRRIVTDNTPDYLKELFMHNDEACQCQIDYEKVFDFSDMKFNSLQELRGIIFLLSSSIVYSVGSYLDNEESLEEGKNKLHHMFEIIRHGVSKGE